MLISLSLVHEKAQSLFNNLKAACAANEDKCDEEFVACMGWSSCFKESANLHNIKVQGEAPSDDVRAASDFPETLEKMIDDGVYLPDQIFYVHETGLF